MDEKKNKVLFVLGLIFGIFLFLFSGYFLTKFKDAEIEFGNEITAKDFVRYGTVSNVKIDMSKVKNDNQYTYTKGNTSLIFIVQDDLIESVEYRLNNLD